MALRRSPLVVLASQVAAVVADRVDLEVLPETTTVVVVAVAVLAQAVAVADRVLVASLFAPNDTKEKSLLSNCSGGISFFGWRDSYA